MANEFHVLSLTPRQQAAMRFMLYNLFCSFVQNTMEDLGNFLYSEKGESMITAKYRAIIENFDKYDNFTEVFCSKKQTARAEIRMITFSPESMKVLVLAIKRFDKNNCFLSPGDVQYIISEFDKLSDKVKTSAQFTYTQEEISNGGKS